jgi:hypothetical protein
MGMFDDELNEGMRLTRQLMEKEGISYEVARERVRSMSANGERRVLQRELYDARYVLASLLAHRNQLEEDISYTLERINEIKRTAHETGETVK